MPEMDEKKIERCFQKISQFQSSPAVAARDLDRARERLTKHMSRQRTKKPGIWRLFMRSGISKAAAAAVLIIAAAIVIHQSGGSVGLTTIALADISEAMKKVPWMRMTNGGLNGFGGNVAPPTELLLGFHTKIAASKDGKGNITLSDYSEHKSYTYDLEDGALTIDYLDKDDFPAYLSSAFVVVESMQKMSQQQGARVVTTEGEYQGEKVQLQEISMEGAAQAARLCIQLDSKLLLAIQVMVTDPNGNKTVAGELAIDYPQTGPASVYDLGVPRDARIIDKLPERDYQKIWDNYRQKRAEATREYIAVITLRRRSEEDPVTMIDVDYKSNRNHRMERHSVFNAGEVLSKYWPERKEKLGNTFESLLAWTKDHYHIKGTISVHLYDGQHNFSTSRDGDGSWSELRKHYSPDVELLPLNHLEYLGWRNVLITGRIIEDDYAQQNDLICIESLQQGSVRSGNVLLPGRFLRYLDPQKDYMCRRQVTERCPDAEWQEDKNWLEGVEPDKIRDGSITVYDITEVIHNIAERTDTECDDTSKQDWGGESD